MLPLHGPSQFMTTTDTSTAVHFEIDLDHGDIKLQAWSILLRSADTLQENVAGFFGLVQDRDDTSSTLTTGSFQ